MKIDFGSHKEKGIIRPLIGLLGWAASTGTAETARLAVLIMACGVSLALWHLT